MKGGKGKEGQKAGKKKGTEGNLGSKDGWGEGVSTERGVCWGCRDRTGGERERSMEGRFDSPSCSNLPETGPASLCKEWHKRHRRLLF